MGIVSFASQLLSRGVHHRPTQGAVLGGFLVREGIILDGCGYVGTLGFCARKIFLFFDKINFL